MNEINYLISFLKSKDISISGYVIRREGLYYSLINYEYQVIYLLRPTNWYDEEYINKLGQDGFKVNLVYLTQKMKFIIYEFTSI
ncbi:hypothetical protein pb186bvf_006677 [Paramecium bursaria]